MLQLTLSNLISKGDKSNFDRIRERFELERFELREVIYESFLRKFDGDFEIVRIKERFELERVICINVTTKEINTFALKTHLTLFKLFIMQL